MSRQGADALWNRRTPEPGTSVIRWTRYDGTPETLPDAGKDCIVFRDGDRYYAHFGEFDVEDCRRVVLVAKERRAHA